jgi:hypothetical protein
MSTTTTSSTTTSQEMSRAELKRQLDEHRCPVCYDVYVLPVRTPCGHTFCIECLKKSLLARLERTCPCCRNDLAQGKWFDLFCVHADDKVTFVDLPLAVRCLQLQVAKASKILVFIFMLYIFKNLFVFFKEKSSAYTIGSRWRCTNATKNWLSWAPSQSDGTVRLAQRRQKSFSHR